ncbi:MAG: hypothetical protein ABH864_05160 [archaeon]
MKCPMCKQDMELRHCVGNLKHKFIYECKDCGAVISPRLLLLCEPQLEIKVDERRKVKHDI